MSYVHFRIDDRLIHGQVITGWSRFYQLKQIIIVDDSVAMDPVQQQIISMVAPSDMKVHIKSVKDSIPLLNEAIEKEISTLVLVKSPDALVNLVENNVSVDTVIIGGMQFKNERKKVTKTVSITQNEALSFFQLADKGVNLKYQVIPTDKQQDFSQLLGMFSREEV